MEAKENLIEIILSVDVTSDVDTILRCLNKSNLIIFYSGIYLIADDTYIYYFGAVESSRTHKKLGSFVKQFKYLVKGKLFYSKNIKPFRRYTTVVDKSKNLYRWN